MKVFISSLCFVFLFVSQSYSQILIKAGPSLTVAYSDQSATVFPLFGAEIAAELRIVKHFSINASINAHYGAHKTAFDSTLRRKDFLFGGQIDARYHFREVFDGSFVFLGFDLKRLNAQNYFRPTPEDPVPTLQDMEYNIVLGWGHSFQNASGRVIAPSLAVGFTPGNPNEYPVSVRAALAVSLNH